MSDLALRLKSPSVKLRRAFLEEGGGPFLLVFGGGANAEVGSFQGKAFTLTGLQPLVRGLQREFHGDRRVGRDLLQDISARSITPAAGTTSLTRPMRYAS